MIRQLVLCNEGTDAFFLIEKDTDKKLVIKDKVIIGEELYSMFFSNYSDEDSFEIKYDENDKVIGKQIQTLFQKIEQKIKGAK